MNKLLVSGLILLAFLLLSVNINKPFIGQHDWNGVVYGQQAKNFLRFGYLPLKFGATLATADIRPDERKYLIHYTPALPVLISLSYGIFGISEMSTRLVPIIASLASVFLVVLLGKELISFRAGIIAGALMAVTPMFIYYGKNPVHEIVLLPFALLAFYSYRRFLKTGKKGWWNILLLALTFAMLIGWPGYYAAGLIFIHGVLLQPKEKIKFFQLPLIAVTLLTIFFFHSIILSPQATGDLQKIFFARLGGSSVGLIDFLTRELRYSINLLTVSLLFLSSVWLVSNPKNKSIILLLGIFGLAHILIFRQAGYYHEYLLFPLLPFIALASAGTVDNLLKLFQSLKIKLLIVGLILFLTAKERLGYLQALSRSEYTKDIYEEAVEYGKIVKTHPDAIVPMERDVYFVFYADTVMKK
ncbi:MAG: glycosyltransferase family 39 protein [Patescibacteria group bacterium]